MSRSERAAWAKSSDVTIGFGRYAALLAFLAAGFFVIFIASGPQDRRDLALENSGSNQPAKFAPNSPARMDSSQAASAAELGTSDSIDRGQSKSQDDVSHIPGQAFSITAAPDTVAVAQQASAEVRPASVKIVSATPEPIGEATGKPADEKTARAAGEKNDKTATENVASPAREIVVTPVNKKIETLDQADLCFRQGQIAQAITLYDRAIAIDAADTTLYERRASAYWRLAQFDKALADCGKAIALKPGVAQFFENRALLYFDMQKHAEAIRDFDQAISLNPRNGLHYTNRGLAYWALGQRAMAQEDFTRADQLNQNPERYPLVCQGGLPGDPAPRSLEDWDRQIRSHSNDDQAYFGRGIMNLLRLKLADAHEDFCKAIDLNPKVAEYFHARGRILLLWQNTQVALRDFDRAKELGLNTAQFHNIRACAFRAAGKDQEADAAFAIARVLQPQEAANKNSKIASNPLEASGSPGASASGLPFPQVPPFPQAIANHPAEEKTSVHAAASRSAMPKQASVSANPAVTANDPTSQTPMAKPPELHSALASRANPGSVASHGSAGSARDFKNRGEAYLKARQYPQAVEEFTRVIELDPNDSDACDRRGQAYLHQSDYAKALLDFDAALWLNPKGAAHHVHRGLVHYQCNRLSDALADFEKASAIDPKDPMALSYKGVILLMTKDTTGAEREFSRVLALNPRDAQALNNRASAMRLQNRLDEAIADYNKAIEINPTVPAFFVNRGHAYSLHRWYSDAIIDFNRALELEPSMTEAFMGRGMAYRKLGMDKVAEADFAKAKEGKWALPK